MDEDMSYTAEEWREYCEKRNKEIRQQDALLRLRLAEFERTRLEELQVQQDIQRAEDARRYEEFMRSRMPLPLMRRRIEEINLTLIPQPVEQLSCGICWLDFTDTFGKVPAVENICSCTSLICKQCTISCDYKCPFCRMSRYEL